MSSAEKVAGPLVEVWAAVTVVGFHRWPAAPEHRNYLAARHRHNFVITASVAVSHEDRDVEFHDLRDLLEAWWQPERGEQSCESIGRDLHEALSRLGLSVTRITVSEDGFDGATLSWV